MTCTSTSSDDDVCAARCNEHRICRDVCRTGALLHTKCILHIFQYTFIAVQRFFTTHNHPVWRPERNIWDSLNASRRVYLLKILGHFIGTTLIRTSNHCNRPGLMVSWDYIAALNAARFSVRLRPVRLP